MTWVWISVAALVLAAGALVPVLVGRSHRLRSNDEAVAARSRHSMLALYVEDPAVTDDELAAELLRRARERWHTAGSVLAGARTEEDFRQAERIANEGLVHVAAHKKIGIAGPKLP